MTKTPTSWCITVFAKNEEATITSCLDHIFHAAANRDAHVILILNGSSDLTLERAKSVAATAPIPLSIYQIAFADKSNAWNQFVHGLRPSAETYFFVDGYADVSRNSFTELAQCLRACPEAGAATAMPVCGRSAAWQRDHMRSHGGLMGALHALRGSFVERIARADLRLPIGLYRGDGLIGSMVVHDLDPLAITWKRDRIRLAEHATWHQPATSALRWRDLKRHLNRNIQQRRGAFEDAALRSIIYSQGYAGLPENADLMILEWLSETRKRMPVRADILGRLALQRLRRPRRPTADQLVARRVCAGDRTAP
jgi:glycosyltransferase involved in cell wall biosynthesis